MYYKKGAFVIRGERCYFRNVPVGVTVGIAGDMLIGGPSLAVVPEAKSVVDTMARLFELPNISGVKDATADIARVTQQRIGVGTDFNQLTGDDGTALALMAHGGHGCISVTANVAPKILSEFQVACMGGDFSAARDIHDRLMPLHDALFIEPSPAGTKYALSLLGKMSAEMRLPMVPASGATQAIIRAAMVRAGLIN